MAKRIRPRNNNMEINALGLILFKITAHNNKNIITTSETSNNIAIKSFAVTLPLVDLNFLETNMAERANINIMLERIIVEK
jgi:hypothetical protein